MWLYLRSLWHEAIDQDVVNRQGQRLTPYFSDSALRSNPMPSLSNDANPLGPSTTISPTNQSDTVNSVIMPWNSPRIKDDIVRIISQWLSDEGFGAARQALLEEAGIKVRERDDALAEHRKLRNYLLEGNWPEVD